MIQLIDIIKWEQLMHCPFLRFDGTNRDHIIALMYCCERRADEHTGEPLRRQYTFDVYRTAVEQRERDLRYFCQTVEREQRYIQQFLAEEHPAATDSKPKEPARIGDIVGALVFAGVDISWLQRQGLEIIPFLNNCYEKHMQRKAEDKRFWALMLMSPHLTAKDNKKLRDQFKFDWEKEAAGMNLTDEQHAIIAGALWGNKKKPTNNE